MSIAEILQKQIVEEIKQNARRKDYQIYMDRNHESILPPNLVAIQREWTRLCNEGRDEGSCVVGAGFIFYYEDALYKKLKYKMPPLCHHQGSISWEQHKDAIKALLEKEGATDIHYDWGNMD